MIFSWFKSRRRKQLTNQPFPAAWSEILEKDFQHYTYLNPDERLGLQHIIQVLVEEKQWQGCGGFEIHDEARVSIAAQAALLILAIEHDYYQNVDSILIYPSGYRIPKGQTEGGIVREESLAVLGSAHYGGPIVLSWDSARAGGKNARDGSNLVYHEFAHKLDMLDGSVDGTPELHSNEDYLAWIQVMTKEFDALNSQAKAGRRSLLDKYGATSVGEFFAVATEVFFEKPKQMRSKHPQIYGILADFYNQDPAARMLA